MDRCCGTPSSDLCLRHWSCAFGAAALLCAGCATTTVYLPGEQREILPSLDNPAQVSQWPLTVGLYISQDVRNSTYQAGAHSLRTILVSAKEALVPYFAWATRQLFARVVELDSFSAEAPMRDDLAGVIELRSALPGRYEIALHSAQHEPVTWIVPGIGAHASSVGLSVATISYEIRDATANYIVNFQYQPGLKAWLERVGVRQGTDPTFRDDGPSRASREQIIVADDSERDARNCLGRAGLDARPGFADAGRFQALMYPWYESSTAPSSLEESLKYSEVPGIRDRLRALGVRYFMQFRGGTSNSKEHGGGTCGGIYCFGLETGSRTSWFHVEMVDLWLGEKVFDKDLTKSSGYAIGVFILPLPFIPATESAACKELADEIANTLRVGTPR